MSGFSAAALVAVAAVVVAAKSSYPGNNKGPVAVPAAYSINGQNVEFPCTSTKNVYTDTGRYVPRNVIATRFQVWDDRAFVLTPRFRSGVPFTLSTIRLDCRNRCWPVLSPYPCWAQNQEGDTDAIQNAVDIYLDPTGMLWILDTGVVNTVEQPVRRTQPRIFAVDIKTNQVSGFGMVWYSRKTPVQKSGALILYEGRKGVQNNLRQGIYDIMSNFSGKITTVYGRGHQPQRRYSPATVLSPYLSGPISIAEAIHFSHSYIGTSHT